MPPTPAPPATPTGPTSTVVVAADSPPVCSGDGIGADTGDLLIADVSCVGGWATGRIDECSAGDECGLDVFHITAGGWVYDGNFPVACAEGLTEAGMSIYTALQFVSTRCDDEPGAPPIIRPGSTGGRVVQLQIALLGEGYGISADGTYGPRTQAAVRDFQAANGLEVDGIAGPRTQAALGVGPGGPGPTTSGTNPAPAPATDAATTAVAPSTPTSPNPTTPNGSTTSSTVVLEPGALPQCSVETISAESGTAIDEVIDCQAGWAFARVAGCTIAAGCIAIDLFHVTDAGWAYDGKIRVDCAEDLVAYGVSIYTAVEFGPVCGTPPPDAPEIIRPGSSGDEVENLQIALLGLGYPVAVDGTYGPRTQAAVRDFQAANGLEVDGIAGPQTRLALGI